MSFWTFYVIFSIVILGEIFDFESSCYQYDPFKIIIFSGGLNQKNDGISQTKRDKTKFLDLLVTLFLIKKSTVSFCPRKTIPTGIFDVKLCLLNRPGSERISKQAQCSSKVLVFKFLVYAFAIFHPLSDGINFC